MISPISGKIIFEKVCLFHREITKQEDGFTVSRGWLDSFKHHYGIRCLKITGEKLYAMKHQLNHFEMSCYESLTKKKNHKFLTLINPVYSGECYYFNLLNLINICGRIKFLSY